MTDRKKIGVIASDILNVYQQRLMRGLQEEAFAYDCDVVVFATFNSFLKGEMNIFSIINYSRLDGMIVMPDKIVATPEAEGVLERLKREFDGPVIFVDFDTEEYTLVKEDVKSQLKPVLEHLYEEHGIRDIACMTGIKGHPHAEDRLQSYLDFMEEKKLPIKENRIFYGDFWYDMGESVLEQMLNSPEGLPEAVCCTSDSMALSIFEACRRRNIRVPEELAVTGFDADNDGIVKKYFVTSISRDGRTTGINAVRALINAMMGRELPMKAWDSTLVPGETCGCQTRYGDLQQVDVEALKRKADQNFYSEYNLMLEDSISAKTIEDCVWKIDWYTWYLQDLIGLSICLCDDWLGYDREDRCYRQNGYSDSMNLLYEKRYDSKMLDKDRMFSRKDMLPILWQEREQPGSFIFAPLHFQDRCFGYIVLHYEGNVGECPDYLGGWVRNCNNTLETMRRYINMERTNARLTEVSRQMERNAVTDSLTGLYNRNGFNLYGREQIHLAKTEGKKLVVLMADMNNLKIINDTYGHAEGDFSIKETAKAISCFALRNDTEYEKCYRIGGDEYTVIIVGELTQEEIEERSRAIHAYLEQCNAVSGKPYQISVSLGISVEDPADKKLDQVVLNADKLMYEEKQRYKQQTKQGS